MYFNYLYYPSIQLPNNQWLRKVLFYSESIASIVPKELSTYDRYNLEMLQNENEYTPLYPENFFSWENSEEVNILNNEVKAYFNSSFFQSLVSKNKSSNSYLYHSKFPDYLLDLFQEMKYFVGQNGGWWETPQIVGDVYMGLLAKHMGAKYNYIPTSNMVKHQDIAFKNISLPKLKVGELKLIQALPTPTPEVEINKIIKFKNKRKEELQKFRIVLRENIEIISKIDNQEELQNRMQIFREQINTEVNDINKLLYENRINCTYESLKTLIDMNKDLIIKVATGSTAFSALTETSFVTGSAIGYATQVALNIGSIVKDHHFQRNSILRESPYSYAFYIKKFNGKNSKNRSNIFVRN